MENVVFIYLAIHVFAIALIMGAYFNTIIRVIREDKEIEVEVKVDGFPFYDATAYYEVPTMVNFLGKVCIAQGLNECPVCLDDLIAGGKIRIRKD